MPCAAFFWRSSISAGPWPAFMASAMAITSTTPWRVLPFFPAFIAGMNLVLLADDAFTFLSSWEFMSLGVLGAGDGAPSRSGHREGAATSIW